MFKHIFDKMVNFYKENPVFSSIVVTVIVSILDYITGKPIQFPILYILPVGMAAWQGRVKTAYLISILLPLLRIGFHFSWHETESMGEALDNAYIRIFVLVFYTYLVNRVAWQTRALEKKVKILEGILPICSVCKRIRNDKGEYEQIEKYITERSDALFSHGLCKECMKKLYGEYLDE